MNVKILSCWFATSYGTYADGLRRGLERKLGREVGIIASNCGCGDPMEVGRKFLDTRCQFVDFPNVPYWPMSTPAKQLVLDAARHVVYRERARRYLKQAGEADVLHFQQILNAFGSMAVFKWLAMPARCARVVTVHELDPYQHANPGVSAAYNNADGIIVHTEEMRDQLVDLGVARDKVDVLKHGVEIPKLDDRPRRGIVFWGGHKLNNTKGLGTLFTAMSLLKDRLAHDAPIARIHGHYGTQTPEHAKHAAREAGVSDQVEWLNEITFEAASDEYQRALLCVLPFTGSFAGYPASLAMASGAAVIGTRRAGLPEHVGDAGVWVEENDPNGLATAIARLLGDEAERQRLAEKARARAERELSWDAVARETLGAYEKAVENKKRRHAS
jgi:glycosyltransferase involved in cell wall biosynthesis